MGRDELMKAQSDAAAVLREGAELVARFSRSRAGNAAQPETRDKAQLGALIASPGEFWAAASAAQAGGNEETAKPIELAVRYAASRLAVGDFEFVRESLLGQALWASTMAARLGQKAESTRHFPAEVQLVKLALAAQRQASATLATAAALNKLGDAAGITVGDGG